MHGKIIKGIAGFYYIHVVDHGIYECKAKGIFRNKKIKPLVGDNVCIDILDEEKKKGNLIEILPRANQLVRPAVSNIDQALVIFAAAKPEPNLNLLDRFLVMMEKQGVRTIICFNKMEIAAQEQLQLLKETYDKCNYNLCFVSAKNELGIDELEHLLCDKTTVLAGPSGVGKSTILNLIQPDANMETGMISERIGRGKHTTRHCELFHVQGNTYLMDTPGFTSLIVGEMEKEELRDYFKEFHLFEPFCRFQGCVHINEPDCGVKRAVLDSKVSEMRYHNYKLIYEELKNHKKY